jgi:hypothetical protein
MTLKALVPTEHQEQAALVKRLTLHPLTKDVVYFAIPNAGKRNPAAGARMKAEGMQAGAPDLVFLAARGAYHGLAIEMKRRTGGSISPEQASLLRRIGAHGYATAVCRGHEAAWAALETYLAGQWTDAHQWTPRAGTTRWG